MKTYLTYFLQCNYRSLLLITFLIYGANEAINIYYFKVMGWYGNSKQSEKSTLIWISGALGFTYLIFYFAQNLLLQISLLNSNLNIHRKIITILNTTKTIYFE
jgi:hypothetical protein